MPSDLFGPISLPAMNAARRDMYRDLAALCEHTPLVRILNPAQPALYQPEIWGKCEFLNPTGSHHDRQFVPLLFELEIEGNIRPGETTLVEVTSGCAGASFAWAAKNLGYRAVVFMPADLPHTRKQDVRRFGADVREVAGGIPACVEAMKKYLLTTTDAAWCVNHTRTETAMTVMKRMGSEIVTAFPNRKGTIVGLIGSGSSLAGMTLATKEAGWEAVGWEPFASGAAFEQQNPGDYEALYRVKPGFAEHKIYGGSFNGVKFPHYKPLIDRLSGTIRMVCDEPQLRAYEKIRGELSVRPASLVYWEQVQSWYLPVGRSSYGSLAVALSLVGAYPQPLVIPLYDPNTKY